MDPSGVRKYLELLYGCKAVVFNGTAKKSTFSAIYDLHVLTLIFLNGRFHILFVVCVGLLSTDEASPKFTRFK